ncbi:AI-2E family transporter [Candidatus Pacearchaeota archaeon]|nr:AI-2E family transporter [Candidatus Pacearchaeota archaeon]
MVIVLLAFYIARPFLLALLTGGIIAYLSNPLYNKALKRVKNKNVAALIVTVLVILLITVPFLMVLGLISKEAYHTYTSLSQQNLGTNFMSMVCKNEDLSACKSLKSILRLLPEDNMDYYLQATVEKITGFILNNVSKFLASIPYVLLNLFVMVFVIFYSLRDGSALASSIKSALPLKERNKQEILDRFHNITYGVFYGNITVAIVQGILGIIGFIVLGVPSPVLWGFVMMLFALVPYFGSAIIWLPAALNLIFTGYLQSDSSLMTRGVILIGYGVLVISTIDNILKPKLIGSKAKIHPILVLIGVLGGLSLFGLIGFILGPLMLALLMTFIDIYKKEKAELDRYF